MSERLSTKEKRLAWVVAWGIVLAILALGTGIVLAVNRPTREDAWIPAESADLLSRSDAFDDIRVHAVLDESAHALTVTERLRLTNRTGSNQDSVYLRSWTGAYWNESTSPSATDELFLASYGTRFSPGGLTMMSADVNGETVDWAYPDYDVTVLALPANWPSGEALEVTLTYRVDVPDCAGRFGYADGMYMLGNIFPVPAVFEDGQWRLDALSPIGDPFYSECANWSVTLDVPAGYVVAATGVSAPQRVGSRDTYDLSAHGVRDFALVIHENAAVIDVMAGDVLVRGIALHEKDARFLAETARKALLVYQVHYGPYLYPTLTVSQASFPYGGMEYPRMVMIAQDLLASGGSDLEMCVAHETAHQWWAIQVGSDGVLQPWQDEALCQYAWLDYVSAYYGDAARASAQAAQIDSAMRLPLSGKATPGSPASYFPDLSTYSLVVYQRGAALWTALETHLGKEGLDALLQDYQRLFALKNASREDLEALASQHAQFDLSALFTDFLDTLPVQ